MASHLNKYINESIDNACKELQNNQNKFEKFNCQSSINYLKRKDVREQLIQICEKLQCKTLKPCLLELLNIVYLEIELECKTGKKYKTIIFGWIYKIISQHWIAICTIFSK